MVEPRYFAPDLERIVRFAAANRRYPPHVDHEQVIALCLSKFRTGPAPDAGGWTDRLVVCFAEAEQACCACYD